VINGLAGVALLTGVLMIAACEEPGLGPIAEVASPTFQIMDAAHDAAGNPNFFFLPPIVPDPSGHEDFDAEGFDGTLSPVVEICQ
jgi:hypothetical protein